jgi:hypothetical protein
MNASRRPTPLRPAIRFAGAFFSLSALVATLPASVSAAEVETVDIGLATGHVLVEGLRSRPGAPTRRSSRC